MNVNMAQMSLLTSGKFSEKQNQASLKNAVRKF
jgi:hypothetical protein